METRPEPQRQFLHGAFGGAARPFEYGGLRAYFAGTRRRQKLKLILDRGYVHFEHSSSRECRVAGNAERAGRHPGRERRSVNPRPRHGCAVGRRLRGGNHIIWRRGDHPVRMREPSSISCASGLPSKPISSLCKHFLLLDQAFGFPRRSSRRCRDR